jgi:hypothetical protein
VALSTHNTLIIAGPNWTNERMVPVANVAASWEVGRGSPLSCQLDAETAYRLGHGSDLRGLWVRWVSRFGTVWGGIIWDCPSSDGTVEIAARSFHVLLEGRVLEPTYHLSPSTPGGLARQLLWKVRAQMPLPFVGYSIDQAGPITELETRGESVESLLERLGSDNEQWHDITLSNSGDISFVWRQVPRDLTGSILLAEGYHALSVRIEPTMEGIANDLIMVGSETEFRRANKIELWDSESRYLRGTWQRVFDQPTIRQRSVLLQHGRRELKRLADPPMVAAVTVPDTSPWLRRFTRGDTIRLRSWSAGREVAFTVNVITADGTNGTVTATGTCMDMGA